MKVWITGATGMLGSEIARQMPEALTDRVEITDLLAIRGFVLANGVTHIINCAAYTQVDLAESEPEQTFLVNTKGVENLANICTELGLHLTHFSTDYVFDGKTSVPYKENDPCNPLNVYGKTKWEGEKTLGENSCLIRTSWLIGARRKNFATTMLGLMQEREVLHVVDDQMGRPTFCSDLAKVTLKMLGERGTFHFANTSSTTWYLFAKQIHHNALSLGFPLKLKAIHPIRTEDFPLPAERPLFSILDTKKIEAHLNFQPRPWQEALLEYLSPRLCSNGDLDG